MKKFSVILPEKREEIVHVTWHIEAENEDEVKRMIADGDFIGEAEYIDTDNRWGFEVIDYGLDDAEIEEIDNVS
jgi:hypothetical protein